MKQPFPKSEQSLLHKNMAEFLLYLRVLCFSFLGSTLLLFPTTNTHLTVQFCVVHASDGKVPLPSQAFTLELSAAEVRVQGTTHKHTNVFIPQTNTSNKKSVHITWHISKESMLTLFLYPEQTCSVTAFIQLKLWIQEIGVLCSIQLEQVNWEIKLHTLKNQSTVTYLYQSKSSNYEVTQYKGKAGGKPGERNLNKSITVWRYGFSIQKETLAGNKGRKYCFYNSSHEIRCKAIQSLHLTLEQTLQELLNSLITSYFCPHMLNYNLRWCSQDWKYYFLMGFSVQFCRVKWFRLHIGTQPAQTQFLKIGHSEVKYLGNSLRRCKQLLYFL